MDDFVEYVGNIIPLTTSEKLDLKSLLSIQDFSKKELFLKSGNVCKEMAYVKNGFLRTYHYQDDEEITTDIKEGGEFISSFGSFIGQSASHENIVAITDCTLVCLNYANLQKLYTVHPKWNIFGRAIAERSILCRDRRIKSLLLDNAEEKYRNLMESHPGILNNVSLQHIASYLGIKRETLSRIRSKVIF